MPRTQSFDDLKTLLYRELVKHTEPPSEDLRYQEAVRIWNKRTEELLAKNGGKRLTNRKIELLLLERGVTKPKRRPGRPRTAMPPKNFVEQKLRDYLSELGTTVLPSDPSKQIEELAEKILQESSVPR